MYKYDSMPPLDMEWIAKGAEPIMAIFGGQRPDRIPLNPFAMGHTAFLHNSNLLEWYTEPRKGVQMLINGNYFYGSAPMFFWLYATYWCEDYGGTLKWPVGRMSAPAIEAHPFKTVKEAEKIEVLSEEEYNKGPTFSKHWPALDEAQKVLGPAFGAWCFPYEIFVVGSYWVSPENLLLWVNKEPDLVHDLMKKVVDHSVITNKMVSDKYGSANIVCSSLLANSSTMTPQQCREFNIKYLKDMLEKSLKAGSGPGIFYHLCGDHGQDYKLHDDCPSNPASIMHVAYDGLKSANLKEVHDFFGKKHILLGNTDTALLQRGKPNQIYEIHKEQVLAYKDFEPGFIAGLACECPPFAPVANVVAWCQAARDFGKLNGQ